VSLALFSIVAAIWLLLLIPLLRRGLAERDARTPPPRPDAARLSRGRGARPWKGSLQAAEPEEAEDPEAAAALAAAAWRAAARRRAASRRRRMLLVFTAGVVAGVRAWAALGGRWWIATAVAGGLLAGYMVALVGAARRRRRHRRFWQGHPPAGRAEAPGIGPPGAGWGGPVAPSTE
jgi:hypothetical protein